MPVNSVGIVTARDNLAIHESPEAVMKTVQDFVNLEIEQARSKYRLGRDSQDWKVSLAQEDIRKHGIKQLYVTSILYRPFDKRYTYYTGQARGFICRTRLEVMRNMLVGKNLGLITTRITTDKWDCLSTKDICGHKSCAAYDINTLFPLYLYPEEETGLFAATPSHLSGSKRQPNLSPRFIQNLEAQVQLKFIQDGVGDLQTMVGPEDIFHYMYAVFHSPTYRQRYAEFLKIDFPHLPLTSDTNLFRELAALGRQLVSIHLMEADIQKDSHYPIAGDNRVEKIEYKDEKVYINKTQYFSNIKPEVWEFHIGGYQVCQKWLKDHKGRILSYDDGEHYRYILAAIKRTLALMEAIDEAIPGFPLP